MSDIDWDTKLLDPIYERQGFAASFVSRDGARADLVVMDKTAGVEIDQGAVRLQGKQPAACVRVRELEAKGLDPLKMKDGRLTFAGNAWNVESVRPKPKPGAKGELYLFLQERSND
jgi:hypothetical protein